MNKTFEKIMFGTTDKKQLQNLNNLQETFNQTLKISEGIGSLKVINAISTQFKNADGSIQISGDKWIEFIKPYTELPK